MFDPPRRFSRNGVHWFVRALHVQPRQIILRASGYLTVSGYTIDFRPRLGQGGPLMPVVPWRAALDRVRSIDVTTPNALIASPKPHLRITTIDGKEELFYLKCNPSAAAESLQALLDQRF